MVPGQPDTTRLALDTLPGTTPAGPVYWLRTLDSMAPGGHQGWWRVANLRGAEISWERRDGDVHVLLSREQKGMIGYMWTADARHAPDAPTVTAIKSMCPPGALGK
ncbi:MAG: hypothetical protein ABJD07_01480 [Gemmatimonadaceae bacterium]